LELQFNSWHNQALKLICPPYWLCLLPKKKRNLAAREASNDSSSSDIIFTSDSLSTSSDSQTGVTAISCPSRFLWYYRDLNGNTQILDACVYVSDYEILLQCVAARLGYDMSGLDTCWQYFAEITGITPNSGRSVTEADNSLLLRNANIERFQSLAKVTQQSATLSPYRKKRDSPCPWIGADCTYLYPYNDLQQAYDAQPAEVNVWQVSTLEVVFSAASLATLKVEAHFGLLGEQNSACNLGISVDYQVDQAAMSVQTPRSPTEVRAVTVLFTRQISMGTHVVSLAYSCVPDTGIYLENSRISAITSS